MKVLLIKMSSMGDVIHTLPAITDAARTIQNLQLDWVVEENFCEVPRWHPAVRKVIPVALRRWRKHPLKTLQSEDWKQFRQTIKAEHYDCILDAQGLFKSAFVARMAQGKTSGFDFKSAREPLVALFYHQRYFVSKNQHAVERTRHLFAQALHYGDVKSDAAYFKHNEFHRALATGDFGLARARFGARNTEQPFVLFLHGTTRGPKHWPDEHWIQLCKLVTDAGYRVQVPWFTAEENARAEKIASVSRLASVRPRTDLSGMATTLAQSSAFVAVDTGLGHLGAALDIPGISLYGPTSPARIGAYGEKQIHIGARALSEEKQMQPEDYMRSITPEGVWRELQKLLAS